MPVVIKDCAGDVCSLSNLQEYFDCFSTVTYTDEDNETFFFELVFSGNSKTYVQEKNNPTQIYWLWKKTKLTNAPSTVDIQTRLDQSEYSEESIRVMEKTFGDGFSSPGGLLATKVLIKATWRCSQSVFSENDP